MTIRTVKVYLVVLVLISTSYGQTKPANKDTILLGRELSLGMPQDKVMSLLAQDYNLMRLANQDAWMVKDKTDATTVYGEVLFRNGKLSLIERDWTPDDPSASSVALALYGVLEQFGKEGRHTCLVDTQTFRNPSMESRTITWVCGAKRLQVDTTEYFSGQYKGKSVSIQELLVSDNAGF